MRGLGIALILAALAAAVAVAVVISQPQPAPTASPSPTAASPSPSTSPAATPTRPPGAITGALGYPSDFIPPLTVYAISTIDQRAFFSVDTPRYPLPTGPTPAKPSYTITGVAPGTYYVLAYRNDDDPLKERPGVYSQYVVCGSGPTCTDHSLATVTVRSGETVSGIDVTDWYYRPEQTYPPRPR